jgi:hypothetical protein
MSVNVESLVRQCIRFGATPDLYSSEASAHRLLDRIAAPPGTILQWGACRDWQLEMNGEALFAGSLEDCVTELAKRCAP